MILLSIPRGGAALCCAALFVTAASASEDLCAQPDDGRARQDGQSERAPRGIRIRLVTEGKAHVRVSGLPALERERFTKLAESTQRQRVFRVSVARDEDTDVLPMLGRYRSDESAVIFEPRFGFEPGVAYRATWSPAAGEPVVADFHIPRKATEAPRLTAIYPTRGKLPENQLKFYLHFSRPMSQGGAYEHITLMDETTGEAVAHPFLELGEELWDRSGTRFTLFFDPGRIKRGLQPRELFGPSLIAGHRYTLVVARTWKDANGTPLREVARKKFEVGEPDETLPAPAEWQLLEPAAGTKDPLVVIFPESLDHAMLHRVLVVQRRGARIEGTVTVDCSEVRWRLEPDTAWRTGGYELEVETTLEDLAGNSIGRPFEVDEFDQVTRRVPRETIKIPFQVAPPKSDE